MKSYIGEIKHLSKTAITDLKRNKVRTVLTSLGIMIGVMSVVLLIALGLGLKNYIKQQFEGLGANLVMVMPGSGFGGEGGGFGAGIIGGTEFDERDVSKLKRISEIEYVVPVVFKSGKIVYSTNEEIGYIIGSNEDMFELMGLETESGKFFTNSDVQARSKVGVLGGTLAEKLFETPENAVGKTVRVNDQRYKVIGVSEKLGDPEQDGSIIIPYKTTFGTLNPKKTFWAIYLGVLSEKDIEQVKQRAETTLLERYGENDFSITEQSEILSTVNQIFTIVNMILVAIGSISLIVGGIGIMNIMYATVTERTKEVGIRRAVGATQRDILMQFLTESLILSAFGGILGLVIATIIVAIIRNFFPAAINLFSVIITIVISSGIGIFFGVFPARRAAQLPPIEAIRHE